MIRVLEPEVMDTAEDAIEYDSIDNSAVNEQFALRAVALAPVANSAIDLGTGTADIPLRLATKIPGLQITAVDLSSQMLALATKKVTAAGLGRQITLVYENVKSRILCRKDYDLILSNSIVHHIPDTISFFIQLARLAQTRAAILIKDLVRPDSESEWQSLVDKYTVGNSSYQRQLFAQSLRAALTVNEVQSYCHQVGLDDCLVARVSEIHWSIERNGKGNL